jgi:hypothetical protein
LVFVTFSSFSGFTTFILVVFVISTFSLFFSSCSCFLSFISIDVFVFAQQEWQVSVPQNIEHQIGQTQNDCKVEQLEGEERAAFILDVLSLLEAKQFMEHHGGDRSRIVLVVVVMAVVQLVPCVLSLGLFLVGIAVLDGAILVDSLLMISILDGVLKRNIMSVFGE